MRNETVRYVLRDKHGEVPGVSTLSFVDEAGGIPEFVPGQYINFYFPDCNTPEGKAYSISSAPGESTFSITVRDIGEFSHKLCSLEAGDTVQGSLPYGFFNPEHAESDVVLLAAGIGITPFRSMLRDIVANMPSRRIWLFHSIRSMSDAVFHDELAELQRQLPNLSITYAVTREVPPDKAMLAKRLNAADICSKIGEQEKKEFLLCGSISFVRDLWKDLRDHGIPEDAIYTEAFFSH